MTHTSRDHALKLDPALDFLQRLWALSHALERLSKQMERSLGITAQQRLVLRCLGKFPRMTGGQLAEMLHLDPGTISAHLRNLTRKGLVARRVDAGDRRRVQLALTERGRALVAVKHGTVEHAVERLIARVGVARVASTKSTLEDLAALLFEERPLTPVTR